MVRRSRRSAASSRASARRNSLAWQAVEHRYGVVCQADDRLQHGRDQDGATSRWPERLQVLGAEPGALLGEPPQSVQMHARGNLRIQADGPQHLEPLDERRERAVARDAGRLPRPRDLAELRAGAQLKQLVQRPPLLGGEAARQLPGDMALRLQQGGCGHAFRHADAGHDDPTAPELVHQKACRLRSACRGERHGQEPGLELKPMRLAQLGEVERRAKRGELLVPCRAADCIVGQVVGADLELVGDEGQCRSGDQLPGPEQPARMAKRAKLEGEAQPVRRPTPLGDDGQVVRAQRPVPDQFAFHDWKSQQRVALCFGEDSATGHGYS